MGNINEFYNDTDLDRDLLLKATGIVLRNERKNLKISQYQLSTETRLSKTTISNIENGLKSPTIDTWFRLFSCLELDISKSIELIIVNYLHLKNIKEITSYK